MYKLAGFTFQNGGWGGGGSCHDRDIVVIAHALKMYLYVDVHLSPQTGMCVPLYFVRGCDI